MALESLKEVCNDLSTLGTPQTEGRSVRPKINKSRIKSIDFQLSNQSSSSFGAGQQVEEKPRPRKDSGYSFTIDNLEKEMKNLLDMFLTKDPSSSDDVDGTIDITAASAAATTPACPRSPTTTTTNTSSPVTCSSQTTISIPPRTPSPTPTITSTTTVTPPQSPRSPTLTITSTTTASPPLSPRSLTLTISSTTTASPPLTPRSPTSTVSTITPLTPRSPASIATTPLTPRSPTTPTTTPTTRTPLFPSSENLVFTYPSSPTSLSSFTFPSPEPTATLQRRAKSLSTHHISSHSPSFSPSYHVLSPPPSSPSERREEHQHFFSTIKEGMRNFGRRNSLRKKKKKKRPEIGEPQDFRTLTSTTSIKPDADPWSKAVEK
ncbi:mucin-2-like isoform X4 [Scylla paramamosain]